MKSMSESVCTLCHVVAFCVHFHRAQQNIAASELGNLVYSMCDCVFRLYLVLRHLNCETLVAVLRQQTPDIKKIHLYYIL